MKKLLCLLITLFCIKVSAQKCGTITEIADYTSSSNILSNAISGNICLNVYFHIVRNDNGSGGFNPSNLDLIVQKINNDFNSVGISFHKMGINFINSTSYNNLSLNNTQFLNLTSINRKANAINIYIVDQAGFQGKAVMRGNRLVVKGYYATDGTVAHEIGHCLNLFHTHESEICIEQANSSNCETCGDQVCDTPVDPFLSISNVNSSCQYTGGNGYNPDTRNFMSYTLPKCMSNFTQGQATRMRAAINLYPTLQACVRTTCAPTRIVGENSICDSATVTYTLENGSDTTLWEVSSNLQVLSSTNSTITVKPINFANGESFIKASYNNISFTKTLWIGKPLTGLTTYCPNYQDSYCDLNNSGAYLPKGNTTSLYLLTAGGASDTDIEWTRTTGNFTFVTYGTHGNANPQNGGQKNLGKLANIQVAPNATGSISFQTRAKNSCGWGYSKYYYYNFSGAKYSIYPNPASKTITIEKQFQEQKNSSLNSPNQSNIHYEIYDSKMLFIQKGLIHNSSSIVEISSLKKGIYIIKLIDDNQITSHKLIVE